MTESVFKYFTNAQMSNDQYHDKNSWVFDYVSGSSLSKIYSSCLAAWKHSEDEESKALVFGTQSHTNFESKSLFERTYRRAPCPDEIKDVITSQAAFATKLKSFGLTGTSGKQYPELCKIYADCGEELNVLWIIDLIAQSEAMRDGVELIKAEDYDACVKMRKILEMIPEHAFCMNSQTAQRELSIFGEIAGVKVKVRLDHVDVVTDPDFIRMCGYDPEIHPEIVVITDYKTTQSANPNPNEFPRLAFNNGYYLKMALQRDLFKKVFEEDRPIVTRMLAQEKKAPFLPLAHKMTDEQLLIGRDQYMSVIHEFAIAVRDNVWTSYANGAPQVDLETPDWVKRQYKHLFPDMK